MTSPLLVTALDLAANLGPFDAAETTRAESLLSDASDLAREIGSARWTEVGGAYPAPVSVRLAVKRAATRAFTEDADGYSQESLGEWSGSRKTGALDESGVFFTVKETATLKAAAGKPVGGYSVRTPSAYESLEGSTAYAPVAGHSPVPWLEVSP